MAYNPDIQEQEERSKEQKHYRDPGPEQGQINNKSVTNQ